MEYGSYHHNYLCVSIPHFKEPILRIADIPTYVRSNPGIDDQVNRAMKDMTALHEIRHFHDGFGTLSGITLFETQVTRLRAFASVLANISRDSVRMRLPAHDWANASASPDYMREFLRRIRNGMVMTSVFTGTIDPRIHAEPTDDAYLTAKAGRLNYPVFPLRYARATESCGAWSEFETSTYCVPIGFNQLVEGNAHALQRSMLEALWPRAVIDRVLQRMEMHVQHDQTDEESAERFLELPYNITDLVLSKYLRTKHGITTFPRDRLLELTYMALMDGLSLPYAAEGRFLSPGGAFVTHMERIQWASSIKRSLFRGKRGKEDELLTTLSKGIRNERQPETYLPADSIFNTIDYIHAFVRHRIILPMIEMRLANGPEIMGTFEGYTRNYTLLPSPPLVVSSDGITLTPETPVEFLRVWSRFVMFSEIAHQVWANQDAIHCPRAFESVAGLKFVDYFPPSGCDHEIRRGACAVWTSRRRKPLPDECNFASLLRLMHLRRHRVRAIP